MQGDLSKVAEAIRLGRRTLGIIRMISSLIHILIVTPVIFLWLRGREFNKGTLQASLGPQVEE